MQILLHSDQHTDGGHLMAEHLNLLVKDAMERFGDHITRVEAHLSDVNGQAKSSTDDIHCTLEARLVGQGVVVVKDHAGSAHQAIDGAVRKLKRAVAAALAKQDSRSRRTPSVAPAADATIDAQT
jgi:ribosome-associated translation inhibitor RaiA